jgi:hypothetical protein
VPIVLKSGSLNLLEPSWLVKACNAIDLPFTLQLPYRNISFPIITLHYSHLTFPLRTTYPSHVIFRFYLSDFDRRTIFTEYDATQWVIGSRCFEGKVWISENEKLWILEDEHITSLRNVGNWVHIDTLSTPGKRNPQAYYCQNVRTRIITTCLVSGVNCEVIVAPISNFALWM